MTLANNKFESIPKEFAQLFGLEELNMMGNRITDITGLGKLLSIRRINLSQNKIEMLDPGKLPDEQTRFINPLLAHQIY